MLILADLRYGLTIEEMASRLRISERMVYKLLASLEAAGVRLKRTRELRRGGGWARLIRLVDIRGRRLVHLVGSGA
ncbi:MAG TPA: HTH domain-containing protein [Salinarimonas sp.]|nr:HTH domain-containing protein [Salinarimonas sp.]